MGRPNINDQYIRGGGIIMKDLKIKIEGSGDKNMIIFALEEAAAVMRNTPTTELEAGVKWNDGIILTEISEDE